MVCRVLGLRVWGVFASSRSFLGFFDRGAVALGLLQSWAMAYEPAWPKRTTQKNPFLGALQRLESSRSPKLQTYLHFKLLTLP